jgi:DNA-binding transcriptional LysR family regulator
MPAAVGRAGTGIHDHMRLSLYSLQLFVAVAEEGSIAAAAEREHIAASALSKRISELERVIGTPLLLRKARGIESTEAGVILARGARHLLHHADNLAAEVRDFATGTSGHVRVAANLSSLTQFLAHDLSVFCTAHPRIRIDLEERVSQVVTRMVLDNAADIGIFTASEDEAQLDVRPYRRDEMVLVAQRGHPLAGHGAVDFTDSLDYEHVGMHRGSAANYTLMRAAGAANRALRMRFFVTSYDAMIAMIRSGLGIGLMPHKSVALYDMGELVTIALKDDWARRQLKLCTRPGETLTAAAALLLEHLAASQPAVPGSTPPA